MHFEKISADDRRGTRFIMTVPYNGAVKLLDDGKTAIPLSCQSNGEMEYGKRYVIELSWAHSDPGSRRIEVLEYSGRSLYKKEFKTAWTGSTTEIFYEPVNEPEGKSRRREITTNYGGVEMILYAETVDK